jgi:hypothetical protein
VRRQCATIGLAAAIEILIFFFLFCGRPAGGPHRGPPSTARAGVTTDVQRTSNGRPTDSVGRGTIRFKFLFRTLEEAGWVAASGGRVAKIHSVLKGYL